MLIGAISDTHDNLPMVEKAIRRLNDEKVELVLHAGDYVAPFVIPYFKALNAKLIGVFGNNDGERRGLTLKSEGRIQEPPYELNLGGKSIYITHDLEDVPDGKVPGRDIIIYAHTHQPSVDLRDAQLYVNPGELCGLLTGKSTVAVVDTEAMTAEIVELK